MVELRRRARKPRQGGVSRMRWGDHKAIGAALNYGPVITGLFLVDAELAATTRSMSGLYLRRGLRRASENPPITLEPAAPELLTPDLCRRARLSLGWSAEQLATAAGLSPPTIAKFEQRNCTPRPGTVIALRKALRRAGALVPANGA